jgi:hypothetical protein
VPGIVPIHPPREGLRIQVHGEESAPVGIEELQQLGLVLGQRLSNLRRQYAGRRFNTKPVAVDLEPHPPRCEIAEKVLRMPLMEADGELAHPIRNSIIGVVLLRSAENRGPTREQSG